MLKAPCCGRDVTAGYSTGKYQKYLYYRCLKHSQVNISGKEIHEKFELLLKHLSLSQDYIDQIVQKASDKASNALKISKDRETEIKQQLLGLSVKIESVEEKLFSGVINDETYKRSMLKFNGEKATLNEELNGLGQFEDNIQQDLLTLPYTLNLLQVYQDAPLGQKHALVREVFKDGFTYKDGMFRTPSMNKNLNCNWLYLKQIELLEVEQLYPFYDPFSLSGPDENRTHI